MFYFFERVVPGLTKDSEIKGGDRTAGRILTGRKRSADKAFGERRRGECLAGASSAHRTVLGGENDTENGAETGVS